MVCCAIKRAGLHPPPPIVVRRAGLKGGFKVLRFITDSLNLKKSPSQIRRAFNKQLVCVVYSISLAPSTSTVALLLSTSIKPACIVYKDVVFLSRKIFS